MHVSDSGVQLVSKCQAELEDGSKVPVVSWDYCFLGAKNRISEAEVEQREDRSGPVDARWSDQVNFCSFDSPRNGVAFPSCEKVVKMIIKKNWTLWDAT